MKTHFVSACLWKAEFIHMHSRILRRLCTLPHTDWHKMDDLPLLIKLIPSSLNLLPVTNHALL